MSDILQAARSYYGLADTDVRKTDIYTNEAGQPMLVFELALSAEDFIAIGARMKNMQQPDTQPDTAIIEGPTVEAMREAYNALSKAEKGRYGSFARYMAESSTGIIDVYTGEPYENLLKREVVHVDAPVKWCGKCGATIQSSNESGLCTECCAPEEPEPVSMDAVWMLGSEITDGLQFRSSDQRINVAKGDFEYLIPLAMLTDEQKQKAKEGGK